MDNLPAKEWLPESALHPERVREPWPIQDGRPGGRFTAVIDDDPTGIQTVHGVYVYMDYSRPMLEDAVGNHRLFFIQTNSRGMKAEQAVRINTLIMEGLAEAAGRAGKDFSVISRSDSTLRGHYPQETQAFRETYERLTGHPVDGEILVPFFLEGGRFTIGDVHYVREGDLLVPAGQTEFARDNAFGYRSSDLKQYVSEKHHGRVKAGDVVSVSLDELRGGDDAVYGKLMALSGFKKMIVNAVTYADLAALTAALWRAEDAGKRFIYRTAASFVGAYGAIQPRPLLSAGEMVREEPVRPGLVVAGSHVSKTTRQLEKLLTLPGTVSVEINVPRLLEGGTAGEEETARCITAVDHALAGGGLPVLYTSRTLISAGDGSGNSNLEIAAAVSAGIVSIVGGIEVRPGFVIAKGGITSSDVAVKALGIRKALVLGQIRPGVPVVRCGPESRWPGLPYVIFPGNVGGEDDLYRAAATLTGRDALE